MAKKLLAGMLSIVLLGVPVVASAATMSLAAHEPPHIYDNVKRVYLYTSDEDIFGHTYVSGINTETGEVYYDTCVYIRETEHYDNVCIIEGCNAREGKDFIKYVETHTKCWKKG